MASIRIEGKRILDDFGRLDPLDVDHLYLVYRDNSGSEFVIRGGPEKDGIKFGLSSIDTQINIPINNSKDSRIIKDDNGNIKHIDTPEDRGSQVLDLNGRDAGDVWRVMQALARLIDKAEINYDLTGPNSNSFVASMLEFMGIDVHANLPKVEGVNGNWFLDSWPGIDDEHIEYLWDHLGVNNVGDNCFPADTRINLWHQGSKPIGQICPDDVIVSFDDEGNLHPGRVVRTFKNVTDHFLRLEFTDGRTPTYVTEGHHFANPRGGFTPIGGMVQNGRAEILMQDGNTETVNVSRIVYSAETAHQFEEAAGAATTEALALKSEAMGWVTYNFEVADHHTYVAEEVRVHNLSEIILPMGNDYNDNALVGMLESMGVLDESGEELTVLKDGDQITAVLVREVAEITHADGTVTALSDFVEMLQEGIRALADAVGDRLSNIPGYIQGFAPGIVADLVTGGDLEEVAEQYTIQIIATMGIDTLADLFGLAADKIGYTVVDGQQVPVFDGVGLFDTEAGQAIKGGVIQFAVVAALRGNDMNGSDYARLAANTSIKAAITYVVKNHAGEWAAQEFVKGYVKNANGLEKITGTEITPAGAGAVSAAITFVANLIDHGFEDLEETLATTAIAGASAYIGAKVGAAVGSTVPFVGTLIGSAVGAVLGNLFGGFLGTRKLPPPPPFTQTKTNEDGSQTIYITSISGGYTVAARAEQNDILVGAYGDDILLGSGGNNELHGNEGDDFLLGKAGDDVLVGGDGVDI